MSDSFAFYVKVYTLTIFKQLEQTTSQASCSIMSGVIFHKRASASVLPGFPGKKSSVFYCFQVFGNPGQTQAITSL